MGCTVYVDGKALELISPAVEGLFALFGRYSRVQRKPNIELRHVQGASEHPFAFMLRSRFA